MQGFVADVAGDGGGGCADCARVVALDSSSLVLDDSDRLDPVMLAGWWSMHFWFSTPAVNRGRPCRRLQSTFAERRGWQRTAHANRIQLGFNSVQRCTNFYFPFLWEGVGTRAAPDFTSLHFISAHPGSSKAGPREIPEPWRKNRVHDLREFRVRGAKPRRDQVHCFTALPLPASGLLLPYASSPSLSYSVCSQRHLLHRPGRRSLSPA